MSRNEHHPEPSRHEPDLPELRRRLEADSGSAETAAALLPFMTRLRHEPLPAPTAAESARLVATLLGQQAGAAPSPEGSGRLSARLAWGLALLRAQSRVVRRELWAGSLFVILLGLLVSLPAGSSSLPFVLVAPLVAAAGVAFLFGPTGAPIMEIELATAASQRLILVARLLLLFFTNLALALLASALLAGARANLLLWPLVQGWLAPMTLLSALSFFCGVLFLDALPGILLSLLLWGAQVTRSVVPGLERMPLPDLLADGARPWLWTAAALLLVAALWQAGREEHFVHSP